jgi:hypothetical protein
MQFVYTTRVRRPPARAVSDHGTAGAITRTPGHLVAATRNRVIAALHCSVVCVSGRIARYFVDGGGRSWVNRKGGERVRLCGAMLSA